MASASIAVWLKTKAPVSEDTWMLVLWSSEAHRIKMLLLVGKEVGTRIPTMAVKAVELGIVETKSLMIIRICGWNSYCPTKTIDPLGESAIARGATNIAAVRRSPSVEVRCSKPVVFVAQVPA